jgi:histidinol phosphatase-like PHP family hydrolase
MIDLHTHCLFSDGELVPSELVRRAEMVGYRAIAITDHGDASNVDFIIPRVLRVSRQLSHACRIRVLAGIELTHVPPAQIAELADESRSLGVQLIVVHGETIVEPVAPGTNLAGIKAWVDILAHPGLISEEEAFLAAERGVYLEISTRKGHSLTNGHVLAMARRCGASLVLNTDSHGPQDLVPKAMAAKIATGAGMTAEETGRMFENSERLVKKLCGISFLG